MTTTQNSTRTGTAAQAETESFLAIKHFLSVTAIHCHDILNPELSLAAIGAFAVASALLCFRDAVTFDDVAQAAGITPELSAMLMDELANAGYINDGRLTGRSQVLSFASRPAQSESLPKTPPPKSKRNGFVYLLKADTGHYKIGRTKNPKDRIKTFSVKLPFRVEYVCLIESDEYVALEVDLHGMFADKRIEGEWFALTDDDVAYIRELAEAAS